MEREAGRIASLIKEKNDLSRELSGLDDRLNENNKNGDERE